jgi:hypothetical protein
MLLFKTPEHKTVSLFMKLHLLFREHPEPCPIGGNCKSKLHLRIEIDV